ncbi:Mu transposase domain-containing protein, partial [Fulvimarina endophytica]|uniref:Mu transposase domain-containing protein n=1 Tax=Fulvimarina endophytica TaxID=2293836 RepID=UPI003CCB66B6
LRLPLQLLGDCVQDHGELSVNESSKNNEHGHQSVKLKSLRHAQLERRLSRYGMVSVDGNFYSVPDATRRRVVEVYKLADEVQIFEDGVLIAAHPILEGRKQRRVAPGHRAYSFRKRLQCPTEDILVRGAGDVVAQRSLAFYDAVAQKLAQAGR